jgi:uncharacterized protein (DUF3084 family)
MTGYIFMAAILILGGVIATVGDRIGSKVGKARLSVFNLRPRNTATLVTIVTGSIISSSTLAILLATNGQLRDGLFRLGEIRKELDLTQTAKQKAEEELRVAREQKRVALSELNTINLSLQEALTRQAETEAQLQDSQTKLLNLEEELRQIQVQEAELIDRIQKLDQEQKTLTAEKAKLQKERDRLSNDLQEITRETNFLRTQVKTSENRLQELTSQQNRLKKEVETLEMTKNLLAQNIDTLRQGGVRITKDQVLAAVVIPEELSPLEQRQYILQLLQLADQSARRELDFPDNTPLILSVTPADIDRIIARLQEEKQKNPNLKPKERSDSFIVRIRSAGNYLRKERNIAIKADIDRNRLIFPKGETIVSLPFSPGMTDIELEEQVDKLFSLVRFRVVQEGVIPNPETGEIGRFGGSLLQSSTNLVQLVEAAKQRSNPFEIRAVAKVNIFRASSLSRQLAPIELVIVEDGKEVGRFG